MQVNNSFFMRAIILLSNVPIHLCHILRKIRLVKCYAWQTVRIFGIIVQHSFIRLYSTVFIIQWVFSTTNYWKLVYYKNVCDAGRKCFNASIQFGPVLGTRCLNCCCYFRWGMATGKQRWLCYLQWEIRKLCESRKFTKQEFSKFKQIEM